MILVDEVEVVEISADLFCGAHTCVYVKLGSVGECGVDVGEHIRLYLARKLKLGADTLFFLGDLRDVLDILHDLFGEIVKRLREHLYLVIGFVNILHLEQLACFAAVDDVVGHSFDRLYDLACYPKR